MKSSWHTARPEHHKLEFRYEGAVYKKAMKGEPRTVPINVEAPDRAKNMFATRSNCNTVELKGLCFLLQRYLVIPIHFCSIHNSQGMKTI